MAITATATMIAITIKTNEIPESFVVGLGVGVRTVIICAAWN